MFLTIKKKKFFCFLFYHNLNFAKFPYWFNYPFDSTKHTYPFTYTHTYK